MSGTKSPARRNYQCLLFACKMIHDLWCISEAIDVDKTESEDDIEMMIEYSQQQQLKEQLSKVSKIVKQNEFYQTLRNSVTIVNSQLEEEDFVTNNPQTKKECFMLLNKLEKHSDNHKSSINKINYYTGRTLSILKEKCKDYVTLVMKEVGKGYCKSYCEHLIRFYKLCLDYPRLMYSSLASSFIRNNMKTIVPFLIKDSAFWKVT